MALTVPQPGRLLERKFIRNVAVSIFVDMTGQVIVNFWNNNGARIYYSIYDPILGLMDASGILQDGEHVRLVGVPLAAGAAYIFKYSRRLPGQN